MHALNLPASLLPQSPDGAAQTTATAADDPGLLAMFEQALGIHVPTSEQGSQQPLAAAAISDVAAPATTGLTAKPQLQIAATVQQTTVQGAAVTTTAAVNLPSDVSTTYAPNLPATAPPIVDTVTSTHTAVTTSALMIGTATTKPADQVTTTPTTLTTVAGDVAANIDTPPEGPLRVKSDRLLSDKAFYANSFAPEATPAPKPALPLSVETTTIQPTTTGMEVSASTPSTPAEPATTHRSVETARPLTAASPATEAPAIAQVRDTIRAGTRSGTIEVQLDPPELGRVLIELEVGRQGQVKAVISASESDTLDLMRRNGDTLAGDLKDSGFDDVELDWQQADQSGDDLDEPQPLWLVNDTPTSTQSLIVSSRHDGALDIQL